MRIYHLLSIVGLLLCCHSMAISEEIWRCLERGGQRVRISNVPTGSQCHRQPESRFGFSRVRKAAFGADFKPSVPNPEREVRSPRIESSIRYRELKAKNAGKFFGRRYRCLLSGSFLVPEAGRYLIKIYRGATQVDRHLVRAIAEATLDWKVTLPGACKNPRLRVRKTSVGSGL